jgi:hypothetical protein
VLEIAWQKEKKVFTQFAKFMPEPVEFAMKYGMQNEKLQELLISIRQMHQE